MNDWYRQFVNNLFNVRPEINWKFQVVIELTIKYSWAKFKRKAISILNFWRNLQLSYLNFSFLQRCTNFKLLKNWEFVTKLEKEPMEH